MESLLTKNIYGIKFRAYSALSRCNDLTQGYGAKSAPNPGLKQAQACSLQKQDFL